MPIGREEMDGVNGYDNVNKMCLCSGELVRPDADAASRSPAASSVSFQLVTWILLAVDATAPMPHCVKYYVIASVPKACSLDIRSKI